MVKTFDLRHISGSVPSEIKKFDPSYVTRYVIVAELVKQAQKELKKPLKILDLGGYNGAARTLLPDNEVVILDVAEDNKLENYVKASGSKMPFADDTFDVVISCDTLEHIPARQRDDFIREMLRVSRKFCFIGAPFGSRDVIDAELNSNTFYQGITSGNNYIWLKEHAEYGLPKKKWIEGILNEQKVEFTTFEHTSLNVWGMMLRANFFLADNIKAVNPEIGQRLARANDDYLEEYTFHDFPVRGYRTFYVISKTGPVAVSLPDYDRGANQKFMNRLFLLVGECLQEFTKEYGAKQERLDNTQNEVEKLFNNNVELTDKVKNLEAEIDHIKNTRSYKVASKLAAAKRVLTRPETNKEK